MSAALSLFFCMVLGVVGLVSAAQAFERVDDSSSPRMVVSPQAALNDHGRLINGVESAERIDVRYGVVEYRLNTKPYIGRQLRLYYVVPMAIPGLRMARSMRVVWNGDGRVAGGVAYPGDRVEVWSGRVDEPWMNVVLDLRYEIDLRGFDLPSREGVGFESYFVVELMQ